MSCADTPAVVGDDLRTAPLPSGALRFWGHACVEVRTAAHTLLIDPFAHGALDGAVRAPTPVVDADYVFVTHEHADHNARHIVPRALPVTAPTTLPDGTVLERFTAFHDELGGRLRGGSVEVLRIRSVHGVFVHLSDLGERPGGGLEAWLRAMPIDVLLVPCGGFFTLDGDGAAAWTDALRPRVAIPLHAAEDGVALPQLASRARFVDRFAHATTLVSGVLLPTHWATLPSPGPAILVWNAP